ncbi:alpha/beta hydrolase [Fimbriimonas ginsengisoli]|uniref:Alpha/beta hydrolase domain-containing protein n=1 Tax=Fimbriimonas ginsengisoli Gsoil 348 TaxID=661478 RepID=A0A068NQE1_FIMGI|nr:alpha/beta hydrolase [Fimbriimonas ginsengisoli]AIE84970.1 alpha/beta hydrolase domain-containing protein [Fimbriimonas ginsengisoli Gsoil 348]
MLRRFLLVSAFALAALANAQERVRDVIYLKSNGAAFTMDVFKPKTPNGAAIIWLVSGGWYSNHEGINSQLADAMTASGFTVFEVVHGAQPKYTIPEIAVQIKRAVRFVHVNSATYGVDTNRIGLSGMSAGGHLSLLTAGTGDAGNPDAKDPVEQAPSTVAAVVAFMPPTDFLHYGTLSTKELMSGITFAPFRPAFGFKPNATDEDIAEIAKTVSPITYVTAKFPPTLLIHGDADPLVPIQQSESFRDALKKQGVETDLVPVKGGKHDMVTFAGGFPRLIAWFQDKLKKK